jgi:uncharacterized protein YtpQ (UPF0354 family)
MGWFSSLFGPPSRDKFAKLVIARMRSAGIDYPLEYNVQDFSIDGPKRSRIFLGNVYAEYCRVSSSDRERVLKNAVRTWATMGTQIPDEFEDARPDLMPILRSRSYLEVGLRRVQSEHAAPLEIPHEIVADSLCVMLAYDLPASMTTINDEQLEKWGVTFYEAMEVAKQNLEETTTTIAQMGSLYIVANGDSYDSSRLLLIDKVRRLDLKGDPIVMTPNRESLFIAGADDQEALTIMAALASKELENERSISGLAFRLVGDEWESWLPKESNELWDVFNQMRLQTIGGEYAEQREYLQQKFNSAGRDLFLAQFSGILNQKTGRAESYCVWSKGVPTLLPRTDLIMFSLPGDDGQAKLAGKATWSDVERVVGRLLEYQDLYPPRWLVRDFPSDAELRELGSDG